ncbi:MAG: 2'-5' RNA ligase family protein, partial [Acidimicrobiales bacterium]
MARQRLGVVLLVPQPIATQVDGLRLALGDGARVRIAPHITLVPPVNVAERDLPKAFSIVRAAASAVAPLALRLGPVATFAPVNPVAYLRVKGEAQV